MRTRNLLIAIVSGIALALGMLFAARLLGPAPSPTTATVLPEPLSLPDFALLDQHRNPVGPASFSGRWSLVFFGFTHCPDVCPATLAVLAAAQRELAANGHRPLPHIVLVSVDPERDTPETIGRYVGHFGENHLGVTGDVHELRRLTDGLGIYFAKVSGDDGDYTVDHSTVVMLLNPDGAFQALFGAPHKARNFVHDIPLIQAQF